MQTDSHLTAARIHCVLKELHSPNSIKVEEDKEHQPNTMGGGGGFKFMDTYVCYVLCMYYVYSG